MVVIGRVHGRDGTESPNEAHVLFMQKRLGYT